MTSLKQVLNHKIYIAVLLLFITFILILNTSYILILNYQYQQESKRQYEGLKTMVAHLASDDQPALEGYLEHYTHLHKVKITVLSIDGDVIFTNDDGQVTSYENVYYEDVYVARVGANFEASQLSTDYWYGFIVINTILFILFIAILGFLKRYLNRWVDLITSDLEQLNKENPQLNFREFEQMNEQLSIEKSEKKQQKIVYESHIQSLAHDIKTPLTVIDIYTESILNLQMEATKDVIIDIRDETKKIANIVPKIIESDANDVIYTQDISQFIQAYHRKFKEIFQIKQIALNVMLEPLEVPISNQDLSRLVEHLTFNAFYYSNPKSTIEIRTSNQQRTLSVKDHGIGMSEETITEIQKGTYRAIEANQYHQNGTGIGYRIILEILNRVQGRLEISSKLNEGTLVTIYFK